MVSQLKKTIELHPEYDEALNYLGYSYADKGMNLDEALDLIMRAIKISPDSGYIRDSLAWVYFKKGMYEEALEEIKKAIAHVENDPVILEHLGDIYYELKDYKGAKDSWQKSIEFQKDENEIEQINRVREKLRRLEELIR